MSTNLVCEVCGGPGVPQRGENSFSVTLCNRHFNELHCSLQEKKPREALVNFHAARLSIRKADYIDQNEVLNDWMDKEHEYFLVTHEIVEGMKKEFSRDHVHLDERAE